MPRDLWRRVIAKLPRGRVARRVAALAGGTAVAQAINVAATPIITRLYRPDEVGVISLFLSFFTFWAATLSLRYEYAVLIAEDDDESHVVHRLAMVAVVIMAVLSCPILWILRSTNALGFGMLPAWAPAVTPPMMLGYGGYMVYRAWALRTGLVRQIAKTTATRAFASVVTRIGLGVMGLGVTALFAAQFVACWAANITIVRSVHQYFARSAKPDISLLSLWKASRRYSKFATVEVPSVWVNQLAFGLMIPIIASLFGAAAAGWFGLARSLGGIPNTQIGGAIGSVLYAELGSAMSNGDHQRVRSLFYKALAKLALTGAAPAIALAALSPIVAPIILGHRWAEVGWIVAAIMPWLYVQFVVSPLSVIFGVLQAQEYELIYNVTSVIAILIVYLFARWQALSFMHVVLCFAAANSFSSIVYLGIMVFVVRSRLPKKVTKLQ